jgi:hypothetical protein
LDGSDTRNLQEEVHQEEVGQRRPLNGRIANCELRIALGYCASMFFPAAGEWIHYDAM